MRIIHIHTHTNTRTHTCMHSLVHTFDVLRYVACSDSSEAGVELKWDEGDKSMLQIDHSSIVPDQNHVECMSLYRLLVHLETTKKLATHKVSYTDVKRVTDHNSTKPDSFEVTIKDRHQYQPLSEAGKANTMNFFFSQSIAQVRDSKHLACIFRWRFERVHGCLKVQKPYVLNCVALDLKAKQPTCLA